MLKLNLSEIAATLFFQSQPALYKYLKNGHKEQKVITKFEIYINFFIAIINFIAKFLVFGFGFVFKK